MKTIMKHAGLRILTAPALLVLFIMLNSCSNGNAPTYTGTNTNTNNTVTQGANEVFIQGMAFSPATLTVAAGTTVKWTNKDGYAHTVTSDTAGLFNSGNISSGGTYSFTFLTAGTYSYHCSIHLSMTAKIIVN